jgi:phospho-N-acetylmuramoyl-pentapeptide-transferase
VLYHLLYPLHDVFSPFNVFRYITFRAAYATITALLLCVILGPPLIRRLRQFKVRQIIRQEGPKTHLSKAGTPTMGGLLIVGATVIPTLLWASLKNRYVLLAVGVMLVLGGLGFLDDYLHVVRRTPKGLLGRYKLVIQVAVGLAVGVVLYLYPIEPRFATATSTSPSSRGAASSSSSAPRSSGPRWASCGSTTIPPTCSWGTPAPWPWGAPWARWR